VLSAAASLLNEVPRVVLAVSGGIDSMVLLHAVAHRLSPSERDRCLVATFDHGTGPHATQAVAHVRQVARERGLRVASARARDGLTSEAEWRRARWGFLRAVSERCGGVVATAHTRDDHAETVVMRLLRGSGARGLSALIGPSPIRRPLVDLTRAEVVDYAHRAGVTWVHDPSNDDRRYLRNRVRLDLLPAIRLVRPSFEDELIALSVRASQLRSWCDRVALDVVMESSPGRVVARDVTDEAWSLDACALLWQTLSEKAGVALDRRGTERLARFSRQGRVGGRIQLSGGLEVVRRPGSLELRKRPEAPPESQPLLLSGESRFGEWRFHPTTDTSLGEGGSAEVWHAWLPAGIGLVVRAWRDGDRMRAPNGMKRRVKRFLGDQKISAVDREGWPVVVAGSEIVWIPGVRRAGAATVRSGRPRVCIVCERLHR